MFTTFSKLNEGGCKEIIADCRKTELPEGRNPKISQKNTSQKGWTSGKNSDCKNIRWEQLR